MYIRMPGKIILQFVTINVTEKKDFKICCGLLYNSTCDICYFKRYHWTTVSCGECRGLRSRTDYAYFFRNAFILNNLYLCLVCVKQCHCPGTKGVAFFSWYLPIFPIVVDLDQSKTRYVPHGQFSSLHIFYVRAYTVLLLQQMAES